MDELHGVVVEVLRLADGEDRHDVGVMQPRSRPRLAAESLEVGRGAAMRQHLQGDVPPQRLLHGLVHHAHAPLAQLAEDAELANPVGDRCGATPWARDRAHRGAGLLHLHQGGEHCQDPLGQLGMARGIFRQGRPLPLPEAVHELLGQDVERVDHGAIAGPLSHRKSSRPPGNIASISRSRSTARR